MKTTPKTFSLKPSRLSTKVTLTELPNGNYDASIGGYLGDIADVAIQVTLLIRRDLKLEFNGEVLDISAYDTPEGVVERFHALLDRKREERENSPAGRAAAEAKRLQIQESQRLTDELVSDLATFEKGHHSRLVRWVSDFTKVVVVGVVVDYATIRMRLKKLGYVSNDLTISDGISAARKAELQKQLKEDPMKGARYLVGQALSCMEMDMPPMDVLMDFADDYLKRFTALDDLANI